MNIANKISSLRKSHELTQKELGDRTGINQSVLSRIENGTRPVRDDEVKIFADYFKVSADYLLGNEIARGENFNDDETELINDYRWLDEDGKNLVRGMMKRLRGSISKSSALNVQKNGNNYGVVGGNFSANVTVN